MAKAPFEFPSGEHLLALSHFKKILADRHTLGFSAVFGLVKQVLQSNDPASTLKGLDQALLLYPHLLNNSQFLHIEIINTYTNTPLCKPKVIYQLLTSGLLYENIEYDDIHNIMSEIKPALSDILQSEMHPDLKYACLERLCK